uniref:Uncharacterized protein n=1 Tax=Arundo donax TaxID=35708 RepID=A0A0A9ALD0_ARUDO
MQFDHISVRIGLWFVVSVQFSIFFIPEIHAGWINSEFNILAF